MFVCLCVCLVASRCVWECVRIDTYACCVYVCVHSCVYSHSHSVQNIQANTRLSSWELQNVKPLKWANFRIRGCYGILINYFSSSMAKSSIKWTS